MELLREYIKNTTPTICHVDSDYLKYLRKVDPRISQKDHRPFVGLAVIINNHNYVIPLTSRTTLTRKIPSSILRKFHFDLSP